MFVFDVAKLESVVNVGKRKKCLFFFNVVVGRTFCCLHYAENVYWLLWCKYHFRKKNLC